MNNFERSLTVLLDGKVEFVVIGGVAMYAHGSVRLTRDLDICYERSRQNVHRLVEALTLYHPRLRGAPADLPFRFDVETIERGLNFTLATDFGALDLFGEVVGLGQYEDVRALSTHLELFGRACCVLSLDGLIQSKRAGGRPQDIAALLELEALREIKQETGWKTGAEGAN